MKNLLFLLFLLTAYSAIAQTDEPTITKGDNVIIIETRTSAESSFMICSKYLVQKGYVFQSREPSLAQIVTEAKSYVGAFNYKLNIVCLNNMVKIRASVQVMTLAQQLAWTDWYYAKSKGNLMNNAFSKFYPDLEEMKLLFTDSQILFKKE